MTKVSNDLVMMYSYTGIRNDLSEKRLNNLCIHETPKNYVYLFTKEIVQDFFEMIKSGGYKLEVYSNPTLVQSAVRVIRKIGINVNLVSDEGICIIYLQCE